MNGPNYSGITPALSEPTKGTDFDLSNGSELNFTEAKEDYAANNRLVSDAQSSWNKTYDELKKTITGKDVVAFDNTQEAGMAIGNFLKTDNVVSNLESLANYTKDAVSGVYGEARQAYYESPVGKAEISAINAANEAYDNLNNYLSDKGYLGEHKSIDEAFSAFVNDAGDNLGDKLNSFGFNVGGDKESIETKKDSNNYDPTMGIPR